MTWKSLLIRGNEEILCIQNTKDFFVSPYEKSFPSYGTPFSEQLSKVSELFSKMKVSIDLRFFASVRYMLIVIGKIEKCALERF